MLAAANSPASAQQGTRFQQLAQELGNPNYCWSCKIYEEVFKGMRRLVNASYGYFTNGQAAPSPLDCAVTSIGLDDNVTGPNLQDTNGGQAGGGTSSTPTSTSTANNCAGQSATGSAGGAIALVTTILAIVLMVKLLPIAIGVGDSRQTGAQIRMFLVRVAVVYSIFLSATSAAWMQNGIISDFFVDGPLAAGSEIGKELANAVSTSLNMQNSQLTASGGNFAEIHVNATKELLGKIHSLGAAGIITGIWLMVEGASQTIGANIITALGVLVVGLAMAWMFFMFTVSFGLRYLDALIRSMMIFALTPVFAILWIFDSTRDIAVRAIKAGFALAAVFAVSGVVFMLAVFIMQQGFEKAFNMGGSGTLSTSGLSDALKSIGSGGFNFLQGQSGSATALNWLSLAYLMGCGALAIACARLAFDIAGQIFALGQAETGIGREMEGRVEGGISSMASKGGSMITGAIRK
ncbi:MAG: type IV secretion system protein [Phreatobacter sp.]|nr:type IV secretion system protein [Phreatobacter sp.]